MAELYYNEKLGEWAFRQKLRSPYIDYFHGWFFVTFQIARNKSALGAIVGDECVLNELGEAVRNAWQSHPAHAPGLEIFDFQVMPNHFHALVYYHCPGRGGPGTTRPPSSPLATAPGDRATAPSSPLATAPGGWATAPCGDRATAPGRTAPNLCGLLPRGQIAPKYARDARARDLAYVIGLFKSWTTTVYHRLKVAGRCIDIGPRLWQESFYDELVRSHAQFVKTAAYIRNNPANWNLDRFGAVTSFAEGNLDLLQSDYIAYLSSEGYAANLPPGKLPMKKHCPGRGGPGPTRPPSSPLATAPGGLATAPGGLATAPRPIISTFTSHYERQLLERCLRSGRRFIWVCPGGIGPAVRTKAAAALAENRALLLSPVAPDTGVNKQRAIWCNQFVVKNAKEIWLGHIRPGGSLESILKATPGQFPTNLP